MIKNREKVIKENDELIEIGYLDKAGEFILHSFDDEPAIICDVFKQWYKDGLLHRDNNLPAVIWSDGSKLFYNNGKRYWFINDTEYYSYEEIKEIFKNKILELKNINTNILKENNIDAIWLHSDNYLIQDQSQYNLTVLKFI